MRVMMYAVVGSVVCVLAGCSDLDNAFNPTPTTAGSRVAPKLRELPAPNPNNVKIVTVYRFENKTKFVYGSEISNGMTDQLITGLVKTRHFRVVERAKLDDLMTEKDLQQNGAASGQASTTKLLGAQLIFAGAVTELDETGGGQIGIAHWGGALGISSKTAQVGLDLRVIDAATGEILDSIDVRRKVRKSGISAGHRWGIGGSFSISNAMDLAVRECLDEAVFQIVSRYGAQ